MNNLAQIESLIFISGDEGISLTDLESITGFMRPAIQLMVEKLSKKYQEDDECALVLLESDQTYRLATKKQLAPTVKQYFEVPLTTPLSPALLEVLAIIAYRQPITRLEIDDIRGVQSSASVQKLILRNLIEEHGRLNAPGRPFLYATSNYFLDYFGLTSLTDLPALPGMDDMSDEDLTGDLFLNAFENRKQEENEDGTTTKGNG
ncbi:SMC-Scp complex subunit ScpB [Paucilactobacillus suebicus]|uniref:Segregation and condensation protein B n=1 Tax=Paucilactobacillus suebicus DSM 5007 = KCTC 3549 TaxID=1423807 RepID=A0A0R1W372_9LACO|nr:SMC-Scp complex subunit ScpB [Paucilactobacillus suebicus]KRM12106.1 segregation and condensation protein B [Paucilactobacillus suebicus DSM 5007 = KCTC 3549]